MLKYLFQNQMLKVKIWLFLNHAIIPSKTFILTNFITYIFLPDFYEAIGLGKKWKYGWRRYVLIIILLIPQLSPFVKLFGKYCGWIFL